MGILNVTPDSFSDGNRYANDLRPPIEHQNYSPLLAEAIRDAGVPDGVYNVVHGFGATTAGPIAKALVQALLPQPSK